MDTSPAPCIFCGRDRDVAADTCPSCGRGWVDRLVTGARTPIAGGTSSPAPGAGGIDGAGSSVAAPVPSPPSAGEAKSVTDAASPPPPDDGSDPPTFEEKLHPPIVAPESAAAEAGPAGRAAAVPPATAVAGAGAAAGDESTGTDDRRRAMTQHVVIGVSVVAVVVGWFAALAWITGQDDEVPSVLPTTTTAEPDAGVSTTTGAPATTTTVPPSTTTAAPATTVPPIEPDGEPIPAADLALGAFALGPLDFGAAGGLGRLVATFGQPDRLEDAGTEVGVCDGDTGFAATWGPLTAIFEGTVDEAALVGYRLEPDGGHAAAGLTTLSGLEVGATGDDLETVYEGFTVAYDDIDGVPSYLVVRTADDVTLLWGPYSEEGTVEGIYSPLPCDGGPVLST